jgi:uncharacterized protein with HEPN domain
MSREYHLFLEDMRKACDKVIRYTHNLNCEQFVADEKTFDAVMRDLEIIGEASKHIPDEVRKRYPNIDWTKIAGLRDVVAHEYFGLDIEIIWDVVTREVPALFDQLKQMRG